MTADSRHVGLKDITFHHTSQRPNPLEASGQQLCGCQGGDPRPSVCFPLAAHALSPFPGSAQQRRVSLCHAPHSARFLTAVSQACSSDGPKPLRDHVIGLGSPVLSRSPPYFKFCHLNPTRKTPFALKRHIVTGLGDHGRHLGVGEAVCLQRVRGRVYGS